MRVRSLHDGAIEVETFHKRERRRHVLDPFGEVIRRDSFVVSARVYWLPRVLGCGFVIPIVAVFVFGGLYFFVGLALYLPLAVAAARLDARKHRKRSGEDWFSVRMEAPSD